MRSTELFSIQANIIKFLQVHNREIAAYEFLEEFNCRTIPKKYFGKRVEDGVVLLLLRKTKKHSILE